MKDSDIIQLRVLPRVFPKHPYARHTAGLGAGESGTPPSAASTSSLLNVKVVGLYCSRFFSGQAEEHEGDGEKKGEMPPSGVAGSEHSEGGPPGKRHIYVRVQFDKVLIDTMPLEVMREKYPQVLIDYLLSTAVWT